MDKKQKKQKIDDILHEQFLVGQLEGARSFLDIIPDDLADDDREMESDYEYTKKVESVLKQLEELIHIRLKLMQKFADELVEDL